MRYFDGMAWTQSVSPLGAQATAPAGVVVQGPNHALHLVLTLFTFWACGGWAWVWLVVALSNKKTVQTVRAHGHVIHQRRH